MKADPEHAFRQGWLAAQTAFADIEGGLEKALNAFRLGHVFTDEEDEDHPLDNAEEAA